MLKKVIPIIVFLTFLIPSDLKAEDDAQYWSSLGISADLHEKLNLSADVESRFGDDMGTLYRISADASLSYQLYEFLGMGLGYKQVFERDYLGVPVGDWLREYRPHIEAVFSVTLKSIQISDRNMFELRIKQGSPYGIRYRNKLGITASQGWTKSASAPSSPMKSFINAKDGEFARNRFSSGLTATVQQHFKIKLYYLWQASRQSGLWENFSILVSEFQFAF